MRKSLTLLGLALVIISCGESPKKETGSFEVTRKKETTSKSAPMSEVPVDLSNKGIGPITAYTNGVSVTINAAPGDPLTQGRAAMIRLNSTSDYIQLNAEL